MCPATFADVPQGMTCSPAGIDCAYPEGQCDCADTLPVATLHPRWLCVMPAPGCPEPRPSIGSACTQPGLSCNYAACSGGVALQCSAGYWKRLFVPCPV